MNVNIKILYSKGNFYDFNFRHISIITLEKNEKYYEAIIELGFTIFILLTTFIEKVDEDAL
jgi:hypothetical protein